MARPEHVMALYRQHCPSFLRFAFRELHGGQPLVETPSIDILADHLARVASGDINRLIINMPPQSLKSLAASIALPVWLLGRDPTKQIISVAGSRNHTANLEAATQELIQTDRCQALFPHMRAENRPGEIILPHGGRRRSATVGSRLRGRDIDLVVVDDPVIPAQIHDAAKLKAVSQWFEAEVLQRLDNQSSGAIVIVTRRLHIGDLCGHLLGDNQSWVHLNMPAIAPEDTRWVLSDGRIINRRQGEALAPELVDKQLLYQRMCEVGAYRFGAEYLQDPFKHMNEDEMRGGCFGPQANDPDGPTFWIGSIPETDIMAYEVFGVGDCHPAPPPISFPIDGGPLPVEDVEFD